MLTTQECVMTKILDCGTSDDEIEYKMGWNFENID